MPLTNVKYPKTASRMLQSIGSYLGDSAVPKEERKKVWDVLVALRGPDNNDLVAKRAMTGPIRYALFGKISSKFARKSVLSNKDTAEFKAMRDQNKFKASQPKHFRRHAALAFKALDMQWQSPGAAPSAPRRSTTR